MTRCGSGSPLSGESVVNVRKASSGSTTGSGAGAGCSAGAGTRRVVAGERLGRARLGGELCSLVVSVDGADSGFHSLPEL